MPRTPKITSSRSYFESHRMSKLKSGAAVGLSRKRKKGTEDRAEGTLLFRAVLLKLEVQGGHMGVLSEGRFWEFPSWLSD